MTLIKPTQQILWCLSLSFLLASLGCGDSGSEAFLTQASSNLSTCEFKPVDNPHLPSFPNLGKYGQGGIAKGRLFEDPNHPEVDPLQYCSYRFQIKNPQIVKDIVSQREIFSYDGVIGSGAVHYATFLTTMSGWVDDWIGSLVGLKLEVPEYQMYPLNHNFLTQRFPIERFSQLCSIRYRSYFGTSHEKEDLWGSWENVGSSEEEEYKEEFTYDRVYPYPKTENNHSTIKVSTYHTETTPFVGTNRDWFFHTYLIIRFFQYSQEKDVTNQVLMICQKANKYRLELYHRDAGGHPREGASQLPEGAGPPPGFTWQELQDLMPYMKVTKTTEDGGA